MFSWLKGKSGPGAAGLYGKIPNRGDFVRLNASDKAVSDYDGWLQAAVAKMTGAGVHLVDEPVYFIFRAPDAKRGLIGALRPSRDSVGRQYPVSVFTVVDAAMLSQSFSVVPVAFDGFFQSVGQVLSMSNRTSAGELGAWLQKAVPPTADQIAEATERVARELSQERPDTFLNRALAQQDQRQRLYAFFSFVNAAKVVGQAEPSKPGPTLDCPIETRQDVVIWLTLAARILKWKKGAPSIFWRERSPARLLMSFGPAPQATLQYMADASATATKLWPLVTDDETALSAAESSWDEAKQDAVAGRVGSLSHMVDALVG